MNKILHKLKNTNIPVIVPIRAESYSINNNCFYNVLDKVKIDNGLIVYGWKLHKSTFLEEAQRHAVWKSPNGELVDVTPDEVYKDRILFLEEDKSWVYDGKYYDNIRVNTTKNPLVDDYIILNETITMLWQTGIRSSRININIPEPIVKYIEILDIYKLKLEKYILENNDSNGICYCGQEKYYRDCHGNYLVNLIYKLNEFTHRNTNN